MYILKFPPTKNCRVMIAVLVVLALEWLYFVLFEGRELRVSYGCFDLGRKVLTMEGLDVGQFDSPT